MSMKWHKFHGCARFSSRINTKSECKQAFHHLKMYHFGQRLGHDIFSWQLSYWSHRYRRWVSLGISHLNHWSRVSTTGRLQTDPFGNPPKNHAWCPNFFSKVGEKFTRLSGLYAMAKIWLLYGHYLAITLYETQWKIECLCIARWWVTNQ